MGLENVAGQFSDDQSLAKLKEEVADEKAEIGQELDEDEMDAPPEDLDLNPAENPLY